MNWLCSIKFKEIQKKSIYFSLAFILKKQNGIKVYTFVSYASDAGS